MGNFFIENPASLLKIEKIIIDVSIDPAPEMIQLQNKTLESIKSIYDKFFQANSFANDCLYLSKKCFLGLVKNEIDNSYQIFDCFDRKKKMYFHFYNFITVMVLTSFSRFDDKIRFLYEMYKSNITSEITKFEFSYIFARVIKSISAFLNQHFTSKRNLLKLSTTILNTSEVQTEGYIELRDFFDIIHKRPQFFKFINKYSNQNSLFFDFSKCNFSKFSLLLNKESGTKRILFPHSKIFLYNLSNMHLQKEKEYFKKLKGDKVDTKNLFYLKNKRINSLKTLFQKIDILKKMKNIFNSNDLFLSKNQLPSTTGLVYSPNQKIITQNHSLEERDFTKSRNKEKSPNSLFITGDISDKLSLISKSPISNTVVNWNNLNNSNNQNNKIKYDLKFGRKNTSNYQKHCNFTGYKYSFHKMNNTSELNKITFISNKILEEIQECFFILRSGKTIHMNLINKTHGLVKEMLHTFVKLREERKEIPKFNELIKIHLINLSGIQISQIINYLLKKI